MVTSLTAALFLHLTSQRPQPAGATAISLAAGDGALIQNLAQYVHSLAQGKVGSGFDVSAAVYGSQTYRRFAVECLGALLSTKDASPVRYLHFAFCLQRLTRRFATADSESSTTSSVTRVEFNVDRRFDISDR